MQKLNISVGSDINVVIVLPNLIGGLEEIEKNVEQLIDDQPFKEQLVKIDLPKFTTETKIEFKPILQNVSGVLLISISRT